MFVSAIPALAGLFILMFSLVLHSSFGGQLVLSGVFLIAPFILLQYILIIKHCRYYYLENYRYPGSYRRYILPFLYIEPFGPLRIFYIVKHIIPYMRFKKRYSYSKESQMIPLKNLKVTVYYLDEDSSPRKKEVEIYKSPVYEYLRTGSEDIWIHYHSFVVRKRYPKYSYSLKRFRKLLKTIKDTDYNKKFPPLRVKDGLIRDGMHRASILYYLYGAEFRVETISKLKGEQKR